MPTKNHTKRNNSRKSDGKNETNTAKWGFWGTIIAAIITGGFIISQTILQSSTEKKNLESQVVLTQAAELRLTPITANFLTHEDENRVFSIDIPEDMFVINHVIDDPDIYRVDFTSEDLIGIYLQFFALESKEISDTQWDTGLDYLYSVIYPINDEGFDSEQKITRNFNTGRVPHSNLKEYYWYSEKYGNIYVLSLQEEKDGAFASLKIIVHELYWKANEPKLREVLASFKWDSQAVRKVANKP